MIQCKCLTCDKIFYKYPSQVKCGEYKYCSKECYGISRRNKKFSEQHRSKIGEAQRGSRNHRWKGGITLSSQGYVLILKRDHPNAMPNNYIKRARYVMEQILGRYLTSNEEVHHINGIRNDDRPENLKLFTSKSEHSSFHYPEGSYFGNQAPK